MKTLEERQAEMRDRIKMGPDRAERRTLSTRCPGCNHGVRIYSGRLEQHSKLDGEPCKFSGRKW